MSRVTLITVVAAAATLALLLVAVYRARRRSVDRAVAVKWSPNIRTEHRPSVSLRDVEAALRGASRRYWSPITVSAQLPSLKSTFGGAPALSEDETWPACVNCGDPMPLFLQLDSSEMPTAVPWSGLLQFFYCTNSVRECEVECDAWAPRAKSTLLRVVDPSAVAVRGALAGNAFPQQTIERWDERFDFPSTEDYAAANIQVPDEVWDQLYDRFHPAEGDKLFGWPSWVQAAEYPDCTVCGARMTVIFQVASEDHIPYMFGDLGTGHISICANHPQELAFGWACS